MRRFKPSRSRVVRIGTHGLRTSSKSTLWGRLSAHRGTAGGYGNHGSSIYRQHVGTAIKNRDSLSEPATWGKQSVSEVGKELVRDMERRVSEYLATTSVLWLGVDDAPGPESDRAHIEKNAIALLSTRSALSDLPSRDWLGQHTKKKEVVDSGLWNVDHVGVRYDSGFLDRMERHVVRTSPR